MSEWAEFGGVIGRYRNESTPWWPDPVRAPAGAPNVLVVLLDDVGFAQLGCFGSDIATPTFDRLAANGLRYTNFHTTALCSPTRACVLTGRNHHKVGMGRITDLATGFPGHHARMGKDHGFLSEVLGPLGYGAYAVGKWLLTRDDERHLGASRARWRLQRGFDRFYGFFGGETHQFAPSLVHDSHRVAPPRSWEDGYHLSEDIADRAIEFVADLDAVDPDKPFFLYLCTGACHSPHHAPAEWIERYRGHFDAGWDAWREATFTRQQELGVLPEGTELSPRPEWVPAWDSLPPDEQRVAARYMECFAAFLSHADQPVGRVLDFLAEIGRLDDTLVFALSDNGASSEGGKHGSINDARPWNLAGRPVDEAVARIDEIGGPRAPNNYPRGWTAAGKTPIRRWKGEGQEGGGARPRIRSWAGPRSPGGGKAPQDWASGGPARTGPRRAVVERSGDEPRVAARQLAVRPHLRRRSAGHRRAPPVRVLPLRGAGHRGGGRQRAQPLAPHHGRGRGAPGRRRRDPARAGVGARRIRLLRAGLPVAVCAQLRLPRGTPDHVLDRAHAGTAHG